jgi:hypothetical protein
VNSAGAPVGAPRRLGLRAWACVRTVWEFVVGDDWRLALGVGLALGVTSALVAADVPAWWVMPLAVIGLLAFSVGRSARR